MEATTTVISRPNPYVGPRAFKTGEVIYGRERETAELLDLLVAERIVLLYSPSGAGKSSLVNATILPRMEEQGFCVLPVMRVNMEPPEKASLIKGFNRYIYSLVQSLEEPFKKDQRIENHTLTTLRFPQYLHEFKQRIQQVNPKYSADMPTLLVFDQFEEIITINPTDQKVKTDFFMQVGEVLRDRNVWALFSIREDYVASLDPYLRPIPTNLSTRYRLNLLETAQAIDAIRKPAEKMGVEFESDPANQRDAAQALVDDLRMVRIQQPDGSVEELPGMYVPTVQLQVVCRQLWTKLKHDQHLVTLEDVKAAGNVSTALGDYYATQVAIVANETQVSERAIREWFDRKLITVQGIRGQVLMAPDESEGLPNKAIWRLEQTYLVRVEKRGGATWFELAHDRLMRPVRENNGGWFAEHLSSVQRQADVWNQSGRIEGMLFVDKELAAAEEWASQNKGIVTPTEVDFLAACRLRNARVKGERRTNRIIRWLFIASVIALVVAVYAIYLAYQAGQIATARGLAAAAQSNLEADPELSILLALEGLKISPEDEVIRALHRSVPASRMRQQFIGHEDKVYGVSYHPDGAIIASASKDGNVKIWDVATGKCLRTFALVNRTNDNDYGASAVAFSPDGKQLAAVDSQGDLVVWDTSSWEPVINQHISESTLWWVTYSPDSTLIATGGSDAIARIFDAASGSLVRSFEGHSDVIEAVAFNADGSLLATGSDDGTARVWDTQTGKELLKIKHDNNAIGTSTRVMGVAFQPGKNILASSGTDSYVRFWELPTGRMTLQINAHIDWVYGIGFSRDGSAIITSGADRAIHFFGTDYGQPILTLNGHTDQVFLAVLSPDADQRYLASASADHTLRLWDVSWAGGAELAAFDSKYRLEQVKYSPDGKVLASAQTASNPQNPSEPDVTQPGLIVLQEESTGKILGTLQGHKRGVTTVDFSPNGAQLASGSFDNTVIIWDIASGKPLKTLEGHQRAVTTVDYRNDGTQLLSGDTAGNIILWDVQSGAILKTFTLSENPDVKVVKAIFSPDNQHFAAIYTDRDYNYATDIYVWDIAEGKPAFTLRGHEDIVQDISYNADGTRLASGGDDLMVIIWDVTAKPQARDRVLYRFTDHLAAIKAVEFSADGSLLASGDSAGDIIVWDMENSERAYTLYVESLYNDNRVVSVDISPNLNHVAAAASDWTLRLFTTDTDELAQVAQDRLTRGMTEEECQRYLNKDCSQTNEDANFTTHLIEVPPGIPDLTPTPGSGLFDVRPTPTAAPTLTPTPTETPTPTPVPQVYFYPGTATYCYAGPGENYSALADVIASSPIPVTGITKDYWIEWLQVYNQQLTCWVNGRYGKLNGPLETIPVVEIPPTPTAIP